MRGDRIAFWLPNIVEWGEESKVDEVVKNHFNPQTGAGGPDFFLWHHNNVERNCVRDIERHEQRDIRTAPKTLSQKVILDLIRPLLQTGTFSSVEHLLMLTASASLWEPTGRRSTCGPKFNLLLIFLFHKQQTDSGKAADN